MASNEYREAEVEIKVKALKLKGRVWFILRWVDPVTGRPTERTTAIKALERNRNKANRQAQTLQEQLQREFDAGLTGAGNRKRSKSITVDDVCKAHADHIKANRAKSTWSQRRSLLTAWCNFELSDEAEVHGAGERTGDILARLITTGHVDLYRQHLTETPSEKTGEPRGDKTLRAVNVAIKAAWKWAATPTKDEGGGMLPSDHLLKSLKRGHIAPNDLSEADLPTDDEIDIIFRWAAVETTKLRAGTGNWRDRRPDERYESHDAKVFADMLRVYYATGARTSELCDAQVRDFMPRTRQICLGKHKRVRTQSNPRVRNLQLSGEALKIVKRHAGKRQVGQPLFCRESGKAWDQNAINKRFRAMRTAAEQHDQTIRDHITPYSFRHLYISQLLMLGESERKVAKLAGTSTQEIERTYGHFYNHDLAAAQQRLEEHRETTVK